ncbi:hypothetical protein [uncultured Hymenobacter sp.]|uniref:hypothetical protein n=1 Tax=uncultured Hymenobacter sp. TaxID=170016 RepID=UPI0035CBA203
MTDNIQQIGEDLYVLKGVGAVVEFAGGKGQDVNFGAQSALKSGGLEIAPWGASNLQPQEMLKLVFNNHLKPQLLLTSRDFLLGSRLGIFTRQIVAGKLVLEPVLDREMEEWLELIDADFVLASSAMNLEYFGNYFTAFSLDGASSVGDMVPFDAPTVRAAVTTARRPEKYHLHPDWANFKASEVKTLPAYDRRNPARYGDFIYHGRDWTPGQKYYDSTAWWGTRKWTEVSNKIPKYHSSGLDNGYNVKYHIKIPKDYFLQFGDAKAQAKAEKELMENMNTMLAGVDNVDKAFVSKFGVDAQGKSLPGWEIVPIENKMTDKAYDSVNNQANIAHTSGHGIDPSLAGIDTGSKMGGSGSEKRISYQLHIALRTPVKRRILLGQFEAAKKIMGFNPEHVFGFEDIDIVTIAENPTGKQKTVNQSM